MNSLHTRLNDSQTSKPESNKPLVTVYMPTKNRLALLKRAIASVFEQSYQNIELIVVDDGSSDGTADYLATLAKEHKNVSFFVQSESKGACVARNVAIFNAKGNFITGLDDDDLFLPDRISSLVEAYDPKYAFVCSSAIWDYGQRQRVIDKSDKIITLEQQLSYNEATTQVLVEVERVKQLGGFDELFVACQDYDLWTRLIIEFGHAKRIAHPTYIINDTGSSTRMIAHPKSVKGYQQFREKFAHLMTAENKKNQDFMVLRRLGDKMPVSLLLSSIGKKHFVSKLRYFLSSNLKLIKQLHNKFYKGV